LGKHRSTAADSNPAPIAHALSEPGRKLHGDGDSSSITIDDFRIPDPIANRIGNR
jgi:hypothetical protein